MELWVTSSLIFVSVLTLTEGLDNCKIVCPANSLKKPVCASDKRSYPSKCEVRRQRICFRKRNLEWVHEGECAPPGQAKAQLLTGSVYGLPKQHEDASLPKNCTTKRMEALEESLMLTDRTPGTPATNKTGIMIPQCKVNGQYEEVQCHPSTDHCWCVNPETGSPIPQTTTQFTKPTCGSAADGTSLLECSEADRVVFNSNLIAYFSAAYNAASAEERLKYSSTSTSNLQGLSADNSKVALWQFNSLDVNGDELLTAHEVKEFKRYIKKNVKPKRCSKSFVAYCDRNSDTTVTDQEWAFCLGGKTDLPFRLFQSLSAVGPQEQHKGWSGGVLPIQDQSQSSDRNKVTTPELMEHQKRLFDMLSGEVSSKPETDTGKLRAAKQSGSNDRIDRSPDQIVDDRKLVSLARKFCTDERETAIAKNNDQTFVPTCQADGRYEATQCHSFSGYCWCVDENSGLPISGTSRLKENPQCDRIQDAVIPSSVVPISPVNAVVDEKAGAKPRGRKKGSKNKVREIPGCPSPNHGSFLTQLVDLLTREMAAAGGALPPSLTSSANLSLEEKAVLWKAITADKNNDEKLSRKEMKFVRQIVKEKKIKAPEKCGTRFMKYCDTDNDGFVTANELVICTEVRRNARRSQRKQGAVRHAANRNPFTDLLTPS